jgi:hypothetical protein
MLAGVAALAVEIDERESRSRCSARERCSCLQRVNELDALSGCKYGFGLSNKKHGENSRGLQDTTMPSRKTGETSKPAVRKPAKRTSAQDKVATTLPEAMTGKASPAKAAVGDKPVFAYIASLPQPQRGIAESVDALAARTLPGLERSVKWGMSYYGVGDGWCFCCGGFAGHVKLMFVNGAALKPVPPVTPVGMGKATRGVELKTLDDLDEGQIAEWMKQVAAVPGVGGKKR